MVRAGEQSTNIKGYRQAKTKFHHFAWVEGQASTINKEPIPGFQGTGSSRMPSGEELPYSGLPVSLVHVLYYSFFIQTNPAGTIESPLVFIFV